MTASKDDPVREQLSQRMRWNSTFLQLPPNQQKEMYNLVKNGPNPTSSSRSPQPFQNSNQFQSNQLGPGTVPLGDAFLGQQPLVASGSSSRPLQSRGTFLRPNPSRTSVVKPSFIVPQSTSSNAFANSSPLNSGLNPSISFKMPQNASLNTFDNSLQLNSGLNPSISFKMPQNASLNALDNSSQLNSGLNPSNSFNAQQNPSSNDFASSSSYHSLFEFEYPQVDTLESLLFEFKKHKTNN
ncbi:hypothetical protein niasHT_035742 [Heterodera trifolii]|uniref:Uncharacterized protein n=1 Tax=Heterodera trifolii TaxID=157864 RepID=A0ABD2IQ37_9BILA